MESGDGIFLTGRRQRKWAMSPHTLPSGSACLELRGSIIHSLLEWIMLACGVAEALLGLVEPWKSIKEIQQILDKLGWDRPSMPLSLRSLIEPHSLPEWKLRCPSLPPVPGKELGYPCWVQLWGKTSMMLGNPLLTWGNGQIQGMRHGEDQRVREREFENPKSYSNLL